MRQEGRALYFQAYPVTAAPSTVTMEHLQPEPYVSDAPQSSWEGASSRGVLVSEKLLPLDSLTAINSEMPVLVQHSSSLVPPQPAGHLVPTNVRPPQCLAAAGISLAHGPAINNVFMDAYWGILGALISMQRRFFGGHYMDNDRSEYALNNKNLHRCHARSCAASQGKANANCLRL